MLKEWLCMNLLNYACYFMNASPFIHITKSFLNRFIIIMIFFIIENKENNDYEKFDV